MEPIFNRSGSDQACILMYHRVADIPFVDPKVDDWNVSPQLFEQQITALAESTDIVPLQTLRERMATKSSTGRPLVALTFDDGYASVFTQALPILKRFDAPATVFVVTSEVGRTEPLAFDAWSRKHGHHVSPDVCRSMNWQELESALDSGLITVGSHSHRHMKAVACSPDQLYEEAQESRMLLMARLGEPHGNAYAYPYGSSRSGFVSPEYIGAVREAGYELGVSTDVGMVLADCDPYRLPRLEINALDRPRVLRAKTRGAVAPFCVLERMRFKERAV